MSFRVCRPGPNFLSFYVFLIIRDNLLICNTPFSKRTDQLNAPYISVLSAFSFETAHISMRLGLLPNLRRSAFLVKPHRCETLSKVDPNEDAYVSSSSENDMKEVVWTQIDRCVFDVR